MSVDMNYELPIEWFLGNYGGRHDKYKKHDKNPNNERMFNKATVQGRIKHSQAEFLIYILGPQAKCHGVRADMKCLSGLNLIHKEGLCDNMGMTGREKSDHVILEFTKVRK